MRHVEYKSSSILFSNRNLCFRFIIVLATIIFEATAVAGPADIVLQPSPQAFTNTCQSYSMGLAMSFHPASPYKASTPKELRELELRLRKEVEASAVAGGRSKNDPSQDDWRVAMTRVSGDKLKLTQKSFDNLHDAMAFVVEKTGISAPETLGTTLSAQLVKTPVLMSFHQIEGSDYRGKRRDGQPGQGSHIVTVLGVQMPPATLDETAKPKLLFVNSAVKYKNNEKNVCETSDLPGDNIYSAIVRLTDKYDRKLHDGKYLLNFVESK